MTANMLPYSPSVHVSNPELDGWSILKLSKAHRHEHHQRWKKNILFAGGGNTGHSDVVDLFRPRRSPHLVECMVFGSPADHLPREVGSGSPRLLGRRR